MIRKRLLWLFVLQILLVLLVSGIYLQFKLRATLEKELGARLESLAATIAGQTDASLITLLLPGDEAGRVYKSMQSKLATMATAGQLSRIVLFNPQGQVWLDSQNRLAIGEPYFRYEFDRLEIQAALADHNSPSPLFAGHDGQLYKSAYAPLRLGGAMVGVTAVEASATFLHSIREMQMTLLQIGLASLLLAIGLSWFSSRQLTKPLQQLRRAAETLGQGDWQQPIAGSGRDEIAFLATTMEEMRKNVVQRVHQQKAMMAGVAHELRNPLGGIELFAGLIQDETQEDESRQRAQRILTETGNLKALVQNFLDYARPIIARPQACLVSETWQEALDLVQGEVRGKQIDFVRHGDARLWADPLHMRQIWLNLLLNAVQSIDQETGRIELQVSVEAGACELTLTDNGRGIAAEIRDKIFEPFFSNREKGLGLGLAMVQSLIHANNGSIKLLDSDRRGARFQLLVPLPAKK